MAGYATFEDVRARAGRYAGLFDVAGKQPDQTTLEALLVDVSGELDAAIKTRGHDVPVTDATVKSALVDVTAYGALARALAGVPGDDGLEELRDYAQAVWNTAVTAIGRGTLLAITLLESGAGGTSAGDLWSDEPAYDPAADDLAIAEQSRGSLGPGFQKGQTL